MKRRILSMLLIICMVFSMLSVTALAADEKTVTIVGWEDKNGNEGAVKSVKINDKTLTETGASIVCKPSEELSVEVELNEGFSLGITQFPTVTATIDMAGYLALLDSVGYLSTVSTSASSITVAAEANLNEGNNELTLAFSTSTVEITTIKNISFDFSPFTAGTVIVDNDDTQTPDPKSCITLPQDVGYEINRVSVSDDGETCYAGMLNEGDELYYAVILSPKSESYQFAEKSELTFSGNGFNADDLFGIYLLPDNILAFLIPFTVSAEVESGNTYVAQIGDDKFETLQAAIDAAGTEKTEIKLLANTKETVVIAEGQDIEIDLNGNVLQGTGNGSVITNNGTLTVTDSGASTATHHFVVSEDGLWVPDDTQDEADYTFDATKGLKKNGEPTTDIPESGDIIAVSGGVITGGTGTSVENYTYAGVYNYCGGGVYNYCGEFTMSGGSIVGNTADYGGGVYNYYGEFKMRGGSIIGNIAELGGGVYNYCGEFKMSGGSIIGNTTEYGGGGVCINDGEFTMEGGGSIIGNTAWLGAGVYIYDGEFTMEGGCSITGNTAAAGGGVYNCSKFSMSGGSITGNTADHGGGVYNTDGKFTMSGGSIVGNTADHGGGVYNYDGEFKMSGGSIETNTADHGGGVYNYYGEFKMRGGSIETNTAEYNGGGVYHYGDSMIAGGSSQITGNVKGGTITEGELSGGTKNNVFLTEGATLMVGTGDGVEEESNGVPVPETEEMTIGVTTQIVPTTDEPVAITSGDSEDYSAYFTSDRDSCTVMFDENYLLLIKTKLGTDAAKIVETGTPYSTVQEAINAASSGQTVQMIADSTETVDVEEANVTLDLNGYVLEGTGKGSVIANKGTLTIKDSRPTAKHSGDFEALPDGGCITGGFGYVYKSYSYGGGVYNEGTLNLMSGSIVGNTAEYGGGVCNCGDFTMEGGSIIGNTADNGGGVANAYNEDDDEYYIYPSFTMSGGSIEYNTAEDDGGGVFNDGEFTMSGNSSISGNTVDYCGGGVYIDDGEFTMSGNSSISGNSAGSDGGGVSIDDGQFTMKDGSISGNTAEDDGGGVDIEDGEFTMEGGSISANTAEDNGGGVYNDDGEFTMSGGSIEYNTAEDDGGGVYIGDAEFSMSGGSIENNTAEDYGGGAYTADGKFSMSGGSIENNTAASGAGGVYNYEGNMTVGGTAAISANTSGDGIAEKSDNLYLSEDSIVTLGTGEDGNGVPVPAWTTPIGVTTKTAPTSDTPVVFTSDCSESDAQYFFSDSSDYEVKFVGDHLELCEKIKTYVAQIGETGYKTLQAAIDTAPTDWETKTEIKLIGSTKENITVSEGQTIVLDLNGYTITGTGSDSVIKINNGNVDIKDTGSSKTGTITGGSAENGGGINITLGNVQMYGGIITGNTASSSGGGVYIYNGQFDMHGGTITSNTATTGSAFGIDVGKLIIDDGMVGGSIGKSDIANVYIYGGIFSQEPSSEYIALDCTITDNTDASTKTEYPYAVEKVKPFSLTNSSGTSYYSNLQAACEAAGTAKSTIKVISSPCRYDNVTVSDGQDITLDINGLSLSEEMCLLRVEGGKLALKNGKISAGSDTVIVAGGELNIEDCEILSYGNGAVNVSGGTLDLKSGTVKGINGAKGFIISGGTVNISGGKVSAGGTAINSSAGTVVITGGMFSDNSASAYLADNYKLVSTSDETYPYEVKPVLCTSSDGNSYESIQAAIDASPGTEGEPAASATTITLIVDNTEDIRIDAWKNIVLDLNGFVLKGTGSESVITNNGTLKIKDSGVTKHIWTPNESDGHWVMNDTLELTGLTKGTDYFETSGGCITGGNAEKGGGIYSEGSLEMTGGNIVGNTAIDSGGGVYVRNGGSFTMSGGSITGNIAAYFGGGVYVHDGTMTVGGTADITGNTRTDGTTASNLYLLNGKTVTIGTGGVGGVPAPTSEMKIGVTTENEPTDETPVSITYNGSENDAQYFSADDSTYTVNFVPASGTEGQEDYVAEHLALAKRPAAPTDITEGEHYIVDYKNETICPNMEGYEIAYKTEEGYIIITSDYTAIPGGTYYIRTEKTASSPASEWASFNLKDRPEAPAALMAADVVITDTTVTVPNGYSDYMYCILFKTESGTGLYQIQLDEDGEIEFTELDDMSFSVGTSEFKIGMYIPATETSFASTTFEEYPIDVNWLTCTLKQRVTVTVAGETDHYYSASAFDTSVLTVSAASDTAEVTVDGYEYTFYAGNDDNMMSPLAEAPTAVGAYKVVVSVSAEDINYIGSSEPFEFTILPKSVDSGHKPTDSKHSYKKGSGEKITFISISDILDFLFFTYNKKGETPTTLMEGTHYTKKSGSTEITLTDDFCNSLEPGEYEFAIVSKLPNTASRQVKTEFVLEILEEGIICSETKILSVKAGKGLTFLLGGKKAGTFDIVKSGCGYKLYDKVNEQYVGFNTNTKALNASEFTWNYDGGLYATAAKTTTNRFFFWNYICKTPVKYYLTYTGTGFDVKTSPIKAQVIEAFNYDTHDIAYKNNGDDTHTKYCKRCGTDLDAAEKHTFENGKCIRCGDLDTDTCKVTDVEVTEKKVTSYNVRFFWARKTTKYQYTIKPIVQNENATTVEYNYNGKWSRGTSFTADKELSEFNIRITDSLGNTTNWIYRNNDVFPEN